MYLERAKDISGEVGDAMAAGGFSGRANTDVANVHSLGAGPSQFLNKNSNTRISTLADSLDHASKDIMKNFEFHNEQMQLFAENQNKNYYDLGLLRTTADALTVCANPMPYTLF